MFVSAHSLDVIFIKSVPIANARFLPTPSFMCQQCRKAVGRSIWDSIPTLYEDTSLPIHGARNARTRGQFKPRNAHKGTSSYQLRQFAEATLGSGSLKKAVRLPEGEDLNEWLAVNGKGVSDQRSCNFKSLTSDHV